MRLHLVEQPVDVGLVGDVGLRDAGAGMGAAPKCGQRGLVHVADMHARAARDQRVGDGAADAAGTGGDQDPQAWLDRRRRQSRQA